MLRSFPRKRESRAADRGAWVPAFAGTNGARGQWFLQQHTRGAVLRQKLAPAAAAVDAHGRAALRLAVGLEPHEQRQPLRAVVTAAGDDGAELLAVRLGELRHGGRLDRLAVPREPEQRIAVAHGMLDVGEAREPPLLHRRPDQRRDVRPELVNLRRIDADQVTARCCALVGVTRGLDHASRIYPTCALKTPELG